MGLKPAAGSIAKVNIQGDEARGINWFGIFWLVFLYQPALGFALHSRSPLGWAAFTMVMAAFVVLYFWVLAERAAHGRRGMIGTVVAFAYAVALLPIVGPYTLSFIVYGASFAGFQGRRWFTLLTVVVAVALTIGLHYAAGMDWPSVITVSFLSVSIGVGNSYLFNWRQATRRLQAAQLEVARVARIAERERIARDLHDLLGHTLSVIVLKSELAAKLTEADPARAAQEIRDVERISREALAEVRAAVKGYRASGIQAELAGAAVALESAGVRLDLDLHAGPLQPEVEHALAFVLREAITNVIRHAGAKTCAVTLYIEREAITLSVSDDGVPSLSLVEGSGLRGMRERVTALGGAFDWNADRGFSMTAFIPVLRPAHRKVVRA